MTEEEFWRELRRGWIMLLDVLERWGKAKGWLKGPRTSEIRDDYRERARHDRDQDDRAARTGPPANNRSRTGRG